MSDTLLECFSCVDLQQNFYLGVLMLEIRDMLHL